MSQGLDGNRQDSSPSTPFLPVIASAVFMVVLTDNVVNIIVAMLASTFGASVTHVNWTITGYALVLAVGVSLYGRVSDSWGVRRVFAVAFPLFAVGSLACALAPDLGLLVAGRILQGTGAAGIPAIATVAVAKVLPPGRRGAAFDLTGGLLIGAAAGLLLLGLTNLQSYGATAPATWGSAAGALLAAGGFAWRIRTARDPFVPPPRPPEGPHRAPRARRDVRNGEPRSRNGLPVTCRPAPLPGPGVWGSPRDREAALTVLREAIDLGVDHIDTARFYGDGVANELIRAALLHPYPADLVLVSKAGAAQGGWFPAK